MAVLEIRLFPDPVLRRPAQDVTVFDAVLERLVSDMADSMYAAPGVGLAAPQVGVGRRLFVIDIHSPERVDLRVFINPVIVAREGEITWEEGCLSFPDVRTEVQRSRFVVVEALDLKGKPVRHEAEDLLAVAIQHELDHLDGKLLIDNVPLIRRVLIKRRLTRQAIESARPI